MRYILVVLFLLMSNTTLYAVNLGFITGDACFMTKLSLDLCKRIEENDSVTVNFTSPYNEGNFCGYAGYWKLAFRTEDKTLLKNLCMIHERLRKLYGRDLREYSNAEGELKLTDLTNYNMFIYNKDFNPVKDFIGLKYNESWVRNIESLGLHRNTKIPLNIKHHDAVLIDWRDAELVDPLKVKFPEIPEKNQPKEDRVWGKLAPGERFEEPVIVDGEIQIIVTTQKELISYFKPKEDTIFYSITNEGIKEYEYSKKEGWQMKELELNQ